MANHGVALVETSTQMSGIVVQDDVFAIYAAGESCPRDFDGSGFVTGYSRVGDRNSPSRAEVKWPGEESNSRIQICSSLRRVCEDR